MLKITRFTLLTASILLFTACQTQDQTPLPTIDFYPANTVPTSTPTMPHTPTPTIQPAATDPTPTGTTTDNGKIRLPHLTPTPPAPTPTAAPTPTHVPSPRPITTARDRDICRRTPEVQRALMQHLNINLCRAITTAELFRITNDQPNWPTLTFRRILHPDDLAGLDNLRRFLYQAGPLDYVDFTQTPNVTHVDLQQVIATWPEGFTFTTLPKLEQASATIAGPAACQMLATDTLHRIFGHPDHRSNTPISWRLHILFNHPFPPYRGDDGRGARLELMKPLAQELGLLEWAHTEAEASIRAQYGPAPQATLRADSNFDSDAAADAYLETKRTERLYSTLANHILIGDTTDTPPCD